MLLNHANELKKQIGDKDEGKEQVKKTRDIENKKFQETWESQKDKVEKIKGDKIQLLKELNIPEKYIVELQNKQIH